MVFLFLPGIHQKISRFVYGIFENEPASFKLQKLFPKKLFIHKVMVNRLTDDYIVPSRRYTVQTIYCVTTTNVANYKLGVSPSLEICKLHSDIDVISIEIQPNVLHDAELI